MTQEPTAQNYYAIAELAAAYDDDCAGRRDLDFYRALAHRSGSRTVVDIGAGTGLLASMLAVAGFDVIAVEPQAAMLEIAARQPRAADITWIHGDAAHLPPACADLVLMTGHVAQYFLDDAAWLQVLSAARSALRDGGLLGFEIRNEAAEGWRRWATPAPRRTAHGTVHTSVRQHDDLVTHVDVHELDGRRWTTTETLRFPRRNSVVEGLQRAGFQLVDTWGDWDGSPVTEFSPEWIVLARVADPVSR